jgi:hypothetical protein
MNVLYVTKYFTSSFLNKISGRELAEKLRTGSPSHTKSYVDLKMQVFDNEPVDWTG